MGEDYGQSALGCYANLIIEGEREGGMNGSFKQVVGYAGGTFAALWTPCTSDTTANVLITSATLGIGGGAGAATKINGARIEAAGGAPSIAPQTGVVSSKVQGILDTIRNENIPVKINPRNPSTLQEGNVTLDLGNGKGVNLRVETHPLEQGGSPVRHGNVEFTRVTPRGKNKVIENIHITK
jgi:hypothetical protein